LVEVVKLGFQAIAVQWRDEYQLKPSLRLLPNQIDSGLTLRIHLKLEMSVPASLMEELEREQRESEDFEKKLGLLVASLAMQRVYSKKIECHRRGRLLCPTSCSTSVCLRCNRRKSQSRWKKQKRCDDNCLWQMVKTSVWLDAT
jgi:hypothetical protein